MRHPREDTIAALVAECLVMREHGVEHIPFERICHEHLELVDDVRRSVEIAESMAAYNPADLVGGESRRKTLLDGRYELGDQLGLGAMGVVYSAHDLDLDRSVAVKVINVGFTDANSASLRFEREATALAAIAHDSVVRIYDRGVTEEGQPFLVMERIQGVPCSVLLDAAAARRDDETAWIHQEFGLQGITETSWVRQSLRWIEEIARGIEAAHAAGVTHRDIKPSNILIRHDGRAVLVDFGIADLADRTTLTGPGETVGTPTYMAPEVLTGKVDEPARQDLYGLAATLYHLLTLRAPYRGAAHEVLAALSVREPERAIRVRPGLPRDIQAVLDHGLARAPQKRYAAAGDMARDLRAILEFRPVSVRPTSTITRIGRRISRSRAALGALAAAALIATVAMGSAWRTRSLEAAQQRFTEAWRHVPANLGVADPHNRRIESEPLRGTVSGALDRLVTSGWGRAFALAYRGIYRLDQGDARGAQLDLEAARRAEDEAFFGGFDALLEAGEPVDLSALPPPRSSSAKLFGAFYAVRTRQIDLVDGFLEGLDRTLARPGEEYRILTRLAPLGALETRGEFDELFVRAQEQLDAIAALEEGGASVTANSAYLRGLAQLRQDRHAASIVSLQESALLGPGTHMALQNIGTAGERGGFYRAASEALKSALEIAPAHVPMREQLARVEANLGRADEARAIVAQIVYPADATGERKRAALTAQVEIDLALGAFLSDAAASKDAAQRVVDACLRLPEDSRLRARLQPPARALLDASRDDLAVALCAYLEEHPLHIAYISALLAALDGEIAPAQSEPLLGWLAALQRRLSRSSRLGPEDGRDALTLDAALMRR